MLQNHSHFVGGEGRVRRHPAGPYPSLIPRATGHALDNPQGVGGAGAKLYLPG